MAGRRNPRKSGDVLLAAWGSVFIALYSAFAVFTFWGALGGLAGALGVWLGIRVFRERPGMPTLVLTTIALVANALAFAAAAAILVAILIGEI
jgi:hypothetical protein